MAASTLYAKLQQVNGSISAIAASLASKGAPPGEGMRAYACETALKSLCTPIPQSFPLQLTANTTYTARRNGWVRVLLHEDAAGGYGRLLIDGALDLHLDISGAESQDAAIELSALQPVFAGQSFRYGDTGGGSIEATADITSAYPRTGPKEYSGLKWRKLEPVRRSIDAMNEVFENPLAGRFEDIADFPAAIARFPRIWPDDWSTSIVCGLDTWYDAKADGWMRLQLGIPDGHVHGVDDIFRLETAEGEGLMALDPEAVGAFLYDSTAGELRIPVLKDQRFMLRHGTMTVTAGIVEEYYAYVRDVTLYVAGYTPGAVNYAVITVDTMELHGGQSVSGDICIM